ncbi:probably inactive leucine-rich repeat receptor-like protein kinase at5g06940 [Phtheirospermum japonicum]|uniref:Probably inactive leucine-rich repeat receptor-like protein kinase at5g06940 n=1 Tax=Phtheirospermum japonicum TaxID=374723 RepID=A0A830BQ70_9LAMI|nr:probably inactive leucine-rich repeat receptor-like protein kinase at5g06940 [Phtheirospermum japonicum]
MAITCNCKHTLFISLTFSIFLTDYAFPETETLLLFKNSIEDPINALSDWSNTTATHYCNWTGVSCKNNENSFVISSLNLQSLNLSGEISASLCNLANLTHLNLADNFFNQPIPLHLSECNSLVSLNLSNNLIWGTIPEQISLFKPLEFLDFSKNHIEGKIPEGIGSLHKLKVLNFGSNLLSGSIPGVFGNFTELVILDLSHNPFLVSEIPACVGGLSKLEQLLLQRSGFYGEMMEDFFHNLGRLTNLDLSENNLTGILPKIVFFLPNLVYFDVSQNRLSGPFPTGICEAKGLLTLSLHTNFFNGSIPNDFIDKCENLERFEVQNNGFGGEFPTWLWSLPKIKLIRGENNKFSGEIPDSISKAAQLEHVQIDNNSFTSKFPFGVGNVKTLYRFSASLNGLYGEVPPNFCDSPVMSIINLSHNFLSGKIPEVKNCRKLVSLYLANNSFNGEIPESLADLPVLTYLDLSQNNLTGLIPQELERLKLALFNISFNQLSGRVPVPLISGLPASFLQGNPGLCGPGLPHSCLDDEPMNESSSFAKLTCAFVFIALAFVLLVFAFGFYLMRFQKRKSRLGVWRSVFFYPLRITEHDLITAMDEKTARGRGGNFGRVYVVNLPGGELVAVKKILNFGSQSSRALKNEVKTLAKIRHKNIAKILGFCHSDEAIFLIYEYMAKGSLGDIIGNTEFDLPWSVRLKIAIGVARGLDYLHRDYVPNLLSRNVKSSNVLLDGDFEPKLTDFALDRIIGETTFQSIVASECVSSCYLAPEYGHTKNATEQNDTYSFGVVLLELLTGRQAEPDESGEEQPSFDVVRYVRRKVNITNGAMNVLDPKISSSSHEQMARALEIGLRCTCVVPEKRPSMCEVVKALQSLETSFHELELSG